MRPPPSEFVSQVARPRDFDEFWDGLLAQSARVPLNASVEPLPLRSTPEVEVFDVAYDSLDGVRVSAWYSAPRHRTGPLPALLFVPGYISDPPLMKGWAREGYALLSAAPRGKVRSNRQFNPGYPGLLTHNIVDRNTYSYRGFYIDVVRAVDLLLSRPEVDGERIGVMGSSQGGGLSVVAAALHPAIRAASAGAPYLCGFMDAIELTSTNPYQEIRDYLRLYPERREAVRETLAYFDGINFAPRVRCPIMVNVGLQDNVCPPETGYALFAALGAPEKRLYPYDDCGHDAGAAEHGAVIREFFRSYLWGGTPSPPNPLSQSWERGSSDRSRTVLPSPRIGRGAGGEGAPADYDAYWQRVEAELAATPMAAEEELLPRRSTEFADCYGVRLTSIGPYRLFAYLSIPHGEGPFPVLYQVPRLMSVVEVLSQGDPQARRGRYVTFSLAFRGQRNADQPYAAAFPGLLSDGIDDPERYIFRGIVADVLRGLEYLLSRPEVDRSRVAAVGANDLALLLAGMRPQVTHLLTSVGPFYDARAASAATGEYPLEEINDLLRAEPERAEAVFHTLSYFDPTHVAPRVRATCLLHAAPERLEALTKALRGPVRVEPSRRSSYLDGKRNEDWLTGQLGFDAPIYPEAWQR
jgi:cephalosporin-C deacetylase